MKELLQEYRTKKNAIKQRLKEFREIWRGTERDIFCELCFCICTPQAKAVHCDKAVRGLRQSGVLFYGNIEKIREGMDLVRFPNNKSKYLFESRALFIKNGKVRIKDKINTKDILSTRKWFADKVKGIGYKEASHFLRNIGFGKDIAILDVHIFKNLIRYGFLKERPKSISYDKYLELENIVKDFARKLKVPMDELDILLWSHETGEIFK